LVQVKLPRRKTEHPDPDRLAARFTTFLAG